MSRLVVPFRNEFSSCLNFQIERFELRQKKEKREVYEEKLKRDENSDLCPL